MCLVLELSIYGKMIFFPLDKDKIRRKILGEYLFVIFINPRSKDPQRENRDEIWTGTVFENTVIV